MERCCFADKDGLSIILSPLIQIFRTGLATQCYPGFLSVFLSFLSGFRYLVLILLLNQEEVPYVYGRFFLTNRLF
jgi:uncharacterized membrane protein YdcZ (DUF606 family)